MSLIKARRRPRSNIKEQIEEAKDKFRIKGDTLKSRIDFIKNNPDLLDIKNDMVTVAAIIELIIQDIDLKEYSGKDKIWLLKTLSELSNTSSSLKERAFKLKSGYFDIEAMKLVVVQIINSLKHVKLELLNLQPDQITKESMISLLDKTILGIETVKVPMITSE